ncbi:type II secretion system protein GspG [Planctomycetia bacterium]|nr:type II secretion system protein GspG [Planctomycetia bacterium]
MRVSLRFARRRPVRSGFTLIEVLLVLAILGVIAAMVVPNLLGTQDRANIKASSISIKGFEEAVKLYAVDHDGQFPEGNGDSVIQMLMSPEQTDDSATPRAPYLEKTPLDAWKNPLRYEYPASGNHQSTTGKPAIWSAGPDRQDDTGDDINNWSQI